MDTINIIGGSSSVRRISIVSETHTATARSCKDGSVSVSVEPHKLLVSYLIQHRDAYIPRLVYMFAFMLANLNLRKSRTYLVPIGIGFVVAVVLSVVFGVEPSQVSSEATTTTRHTILLSYTLILIVGLTFVRLKIARWHAAEHMAITAYRDTGEVDLGTIKQQSRIDTHCGGRFFLPFVLLFLVVPNPLFLFVAIEATLWVDKLYGLHRIPMMREASVLLQKHITTQSPGDRELQVATKALNSLLEAPCASTK